MADIQLRVPSASSVVGTAFRVVEWELRMARELLMLPARVLVLLADVEDVVVRIQDLLDEVNRTVRQIDGIVATAVDTVDGVRTTVARAIASGGTMPAAITAAMIYLYPSPLVCNAGSFLIGFSAAGGILQLGVSVMSEFFPKSKAKVTSIYMMMGGVANFIIPLITGYLSNIGLQYIILLDLAFALLAFVTAIIVFIRYYRVFDIPKNDVRLGERYFQ